MQIEIWNILLNAVVVVLLVAYGIWFRHVVHHQIASKDSTIESLGAVIKANEAEIARLQGETAPAIAESYKRMKEFAEKLAADSNNLATRLEVAESERQKFEKDAPYQRLAGRAEGVRESMALIGKEVTELARVVHPTGVSASELMGVLSHLVEYYVAQGSEFAQSLRDAQSK